MISRTDVEQKSEGSLTHTPIQTTMMKKVGRPFFIRWNFHIWYAGLQNIQKILRRNIHLDPSPMVILNRKEKGYGSIRV